MLQNEECNYSNEGSSEAVSGNFSTYPSLKKQGDKTKNRLRERSVFREAAAHGRAPAGRCGEMRDGGQYEH